MHIENLEQRRYFALGTGVITINGTDSADRLQLTQANGIITLSRINADNTTTVLDTSSTGVTQIIVNLGAGNDLLRCQTAGATNIVSVAVSIVGGDGNDTITGGSGNDTIRGQGGNDSIKAGGGNDRIMAGFQLDTVDGGAGSDTIDYSGYAGAVAVSLDGVNNDGTKGDATDSDVLTNIENILGGAGNDTLIGNANANAIDGGGGNDAIAGRGGNDTLTGGTGIDTIWGEDGADSLFAKDGISDSLNDGAGTDAAQIDTSPADTTTSATPVQAGAQALAAEMASAGFEAVKLGLLGAGQFPAQFDPTFADGTGYQVYSSLPWDNVSIHKTLSQWVTEGGIQVEKKLLIGDADTGGDSDFVIIRLNADGTLDTTFGDTNPDVPTEQLGYTTTNFNSFGSSDDHAYDALVDFFGRIVVVGSVQGNGASDHDYGLARYSEAGVLDTSFGTPTDGPDGTVQLDDDVEGDDVLKGIAEDFDYQNFVDRYVVVGSRGNKSAGTINRVDDNGTFENDNGTDYPGSYILAGNTSAEIEDVVQYYDGSFLTVATETGASAGIVARVFAAEVGTQVSSSEFTVASGSSATVNALALDGNRLLAAGSLDDGTDVSGVIYAWDVTDNSPLPPSLTASDFGLSTDPNGNPIGFSDLAVEDSGRAVAVGSFGADVAVYRFSTTDLAADGSFVQFGGEAQDVPGLEHYSINGVNDDGMSVAIDGRGRIFVAGTSVDPGDASTDLVAMRLRGGDVQPQVDGPPELDNTFGPDGSPAGTFIYPDLGEVTVHDTASVELFDSGHEAIEHKTYITGQVWDGASYNLIVIRLHEDGTLDESFNGGGYATLDLGSALNDYGQQMTVLADGSVVVVGSTAQQSEGDLPSDILVARFDTDGQLDTNFGDPAGEIGRVGYTVYDLNDGSDDYAAGVVAQLDIENQVVDYVVAIGTDATGVDNVGLLGLTADGQFNFLNYVENGGNYTSVVGMATAPDGHMLVLANVTDSQTFVNSATVFEFDDQTGEYLDQTPITLSSGIDAFYATDLAVETGTGNMYVVGYGYNFASEGPAFGVINSFQVTNGTIAQNGSPVFISDVNNGGAVYLDSVAIDENGAAVAGGTFNGQLMVYRSNANNANPDTAWGEDGIVTTPIGGSPQQFTGHVAIQSDGKYVLAGQGSDGDAVAGITPLSTATTQNLLIAARFGPGASVAETILTDQDVQDKINNGDLKWYDDNGDEAGTLGSYFTDRIHDPNLNNGVLNLPPGDNQGGTSPAALATDFTIGNPQDDYFEIGRRFDESGNEYFWVRRSHNENDEGETRQYGIDEITSIVVDGGAGHTKVVIDNALGVPLKIIGEEDNVEVVVKTTLFGDPNSGTPRTIDSATDPAHGTTVISNNAITYTPAADYNGDDSFSYTESHPSAADDGGTIDITLTPVNDAPRDLNLTPKSIQENKAIGTQVGLFSTTDVDDTTGFTYQLVSGTGSTDNGSFDVVGGALVSKASFNFEAKKSYSVRVRVTDPRGATFDKIFTISVLDVAENPTANPGGPYTVATGGSVILNGSGTDPDANTTLTYKWDFDNDGVFGEASTAYGNETGAAPTFTANGLAAGTVFNVKFRVIDNTGRSDTESVGINVVAALNKFTGTVIGTTPTSTSNSKEKAFDGKFNTYFYGVNTAGGAWVGLDMGTKQQVTQIKFAPAFGGTTQMVGGRFQASNDANFASGVVTIYTITTAPTAGVLTTVNANTPGSYRYYRYIGPSGGVTEVAEIQFYGPTDQTKPTKPGKPFTTSVGYTSIALKWNASTDNVGVDHYDIYRDGVKVGSSPTNTFTNTGLTPNTAYTYTVQAVDANGNISPMSDALTATTLKDTTGPSKPANLHAGTVTKTSIQILWNASTDNVAVAYYIVYRNGKQVGTTTSLAWTSINLTANTNYTFTVQAVDTSGNVSLMSDQLVVKTLA